MENKEILEGNKLIAEFMGSIRKPDGDVNELLYYEGTGMLGGFLHNFQYHSSWDWLMPVVEKIENIDSYITTKETMKNIRLSIPNIELVYYYVVESIKWYNQNKEQ